MFTSEIQRQFKETVFDARKVNNHPTSLTYSEIFSSVILDGQFIHGRTQPGWSLTNNSPFVRAANEGRKKNGEKRLTAIFNVLYKFYNSFQPSNALEYLRLPKEINHPLNYIYPWGSVFPWRARSQYSYQCKYERAALEENKVVGVDKGIEKGWLFCGPVSEDKCRIESKRIAFVLNNIESMHYRRDNTPDGDVKVTCLVDESNEWRWIITAGNHRASAAAALGYKSIPIRVNLVIRRNEVEYWPHVIEGLYSRKMALQVFDNFFNGITL